MKDINWEEFFHKEFCIKVSNEYEHSILIKNIPDKFGCYNKEDNYSHKSEKGWYIGRRSFGCCYLTFFRTSYEGLESRNIEVFMTNEEVIENKSFKEKLRKKLEQERVKYREEQKEYWELVEKNRDSEKEKKEEYEAMAYLGKKRCIEAEINLEYMQERDYDKWLDFHPTIK